MSHLYYHTNNRLENVNPNADYYDDEQLNLSDEIMPLVKKLINLCEKQGLFIKILNRSTVIRRSLIYDLSFDFVAASEVMGADVNLSYHNTGLAFGVGIYESNAFGQLKYIDHQLYYDKVAKIGESIGLTWVGKQHQLSHLRYFEFRPKWTVNMSNADMMNELYKRKQAKMSLLAPL